PMADLPRLFLPLYLHHRYQLTAALKSIGGVDYNHAVFKDGRPSPEKVAEIVPAARQREALKAILETLQPEALAIPQRLLSVLPPTNLDRATGTAEYFPAATAPAFDPIACATIAAELAVSGLTQPQRAARLVDQAARDQKVAGFGEVVDELIRATWRTPLPQDARLRLVGQAVRDVVVRRLIRLAGDEAATPGVRAIASEALATLARGIEGAEDAHSRAARAEIRRFLERPDAANRPTAPPPTPPGDPIGG
ncbi:MAG: zinc-dependent metalloprotease, partial [Thermoleophilia bacterium]|nr:zinc-dependent metalloprotease [Thermoleophilia bacterium]